jgi:hypothetical protein
MILLVQRLVRVRVNTILNCCQLYGTHTWLIATSNNDWKLTHTAACTFTRALLHTCSGAQHWCSGQ